MPGYKGRGVFRNSRLSLPKTNSSGEIISYKKWDVNPRTGTGRDGERLVTGDDGAVYYTDDHYKNFIIVRGPK